MHLSVVCPLTGRYTVLGNAFFDGVKLARDRANREGWRQFTISVHDTEGDPVAASFAVRRTMQQEKPMAIVGALESGLSGNHQTLFAKSLLDGIGSILFASTLGIGVLFSALSVFLYQGAITLAASTLKPFLIPGVVAQMSAVGGLLILAIGINLLEIKKLKIGNMLPAIFIPLIYQIFKQVVA